LTERASDELLARIRPQVRDALSAGDTSG
jgi:hypothetical protein